jgi:hypothetical protein
MSIRDELMIVRPKEGLVVAGRAGFVTNTRGIERMAAKWRKYGPERTDDYMRSEEAWGITMADIRGRQQVGRGSTAAVTRRAPGRPQSNKRELVHARIMNEVKSLRIGVEEREGLG